MSDTKPGPAIADSIDEVQAIFPSDAALQDAISRLERAGFDRAELSLPDAAPARQQATPEQGASAPTSEADLRQARTLGTSLAGSVGAMAAAGATIATGGAAGVAIAAAVAGLGAGAVAGAAGGAAGSVQHDSREAAAAAGTLVLSVRTTSDTRRARAEQELHAAGATKVAALTRSNAAVESASWTG